jgi:hypothetical protein
MVAVVQRHPSDPLKTSSIITLTHEEAAKLAEDLLTWVFTTRPKFQEGKRSLPERLASHLWNHSAIRHGLFTPPQFTDLAEPAIISFFHKPDQEGASPPGGDSK